MSDGSTNLYKLAFGLPEDTKNPNPYTLLALPAFTSDVDQIKQAVQSRWSQLLPLQGFGDGSQVAQLEAEIQAAENTLLDESLRAKLDQSLREQGVSSPSLETESADPDRPGPSGEENEPVDNQLESTGDQGTLPVQDTTTSERDSGDNERSSSPVRGPKNSESVVPEKRPKKRHKAGTQATAQNESDLGPSKATQSTPEDPGNGDASSQNSDDTSGPQKTRSSGTRKASTDERRKKNRRKRKKSQRFGWLVLLLLSAVVTLLVMIKWFPHQLEEYQLGGVVSWFESADDQTSASQEGDSQVSQNDSSHGGSMPDTSVGTEGGNSDVKRDANQTDSISQAGSGTHSNDATQGGKTWTPLSFEGVDAKPAKVRVFPDGKHWLFTSNGVARIVQLDSQSGKVKHVATIENAPTEVGQIALSDNGKLIAMESQGTLNFWKQAGTDWASAGQCRAWANSSYRISDDGEHLLVISKTAGNLLLLDLSASTITDENSSPRYLRRDGSFVRADLLDNGHQFIATRTDNSGYHPLGNMSLAALNINETASGSHRDLLTLPEVDANPEKIELLLADETDSEVAVAALLSDRDSRKTFCVWRMNQEDRHQSVRYEAQINSVPGEDIQIRLNAAVGKAAIFSKSMVAVADWPDSKSRTAHLGQVVLDAEQRKSILDVDLVNGLVIAVGNEGSESDFQIELAAFDRLAGKTAKSVQGQPLGVVRNFDGNRPLIPWFWQAEASDSPWIFRQDDDVEDFSSPRCRVRFLNDSRLLVREAVENGNDKLVVFQTSTEPPTIEFESTIGTKDVLTTSPDDSFLIRLSATGRSTELRALKIGSSSRWTNPLALAVGLDEVLEFAISHWVSTDTWNDLPARSPTVSTLSGANPKLFFTSPIPQASDPRVYLSVVCARRLVTVGFDVRQLFQNTGFEVGNGGDAWPVVVNTYDLVDEVSSQLFPTFAPRIVQVEFGQDGKTAICQLVPTSNVGQSAQLSSSKLARIKFDRNKVAVGTQAVGTIHYQDLWDARFDAGQVIVGTRSGLLLFDVNRGGRLQVVSSFKRGDQRRGGLTTGQQGRSLLIIEPSGRSRYINSYELGFRNRKSLRLSRDQVYESRRDSWVQLLADTVKTEPTVTHHFWRQLTPEGASVRMQIRRLSVSLSPQGHRVAVGTPDGVLVWHIPETFVATLDHLDSNQANNEKIPVRTLLRSASGQRVGNLKQVGNFLVAALEGSSNQAEFYRQKGSDFQHAFSGHLPAGDIRIDCPRTKPSDDGVMIGTDQGQLFEIKSLRELSLRLDSTIIDSTALATNSQAKPQPNGEHPAAIRSLSTSPLGLAAYTTPKGVYVIDLADSDTLVNRVTISDPTRQAYAAFTQVGVTSKKETTLATLRHTKLTGNKSGYKLYVFTCRRQSGNKWSVTHVANVEILGRPVSNPILVELADRETIVFVPTVNGVGVYSLDARKLILARRLGKTPVSAIAIANSGAQVCVGSNDGELLFWGEFGTADGRSTARTRADVLAQLGETFNDPTVVIPPRKKLDAHSSPITSIEFLKHEAAVIAGTENGEIARHAIP